VIYAGERIVLKSALDLQKLSYLSNTLLVDEDGHEYHVDSHFGFLPMDIDDASLAVLEHPNRRGSSTFESAPETGVYQGSDPHPLHPTQPARLSFRFVLHKWWVNLVRICQIPCWTCQYAKLIPELDMILCFHEIQPSIEAWRDTEDQQWNERLGKECPVHNHVEQQLIELEATNMKVWL
jgi:hypothetical protein